MFRLRRVRSVQRLPPTIIGDHGQLSRQGDGGLAGAVPLALPLVVILKARTERRTVEPCLVIGPPQRCSPEAYSDGTNPL